MTRTTMMISILAAGAAGVCAAPAWAETLPVSAVYAAEQDAPSEFQTIVVERFDGNEGTKFALALRNAIARARIDGEDYFEVRRDSAPGEDAGQTAWINGTAFTEVERLQAGTTEERKCVRRDDDDKCVQYRTYTYSCSELSVRFTGEVQMLDAREELAYDRSFSTVDSKRYCRNESSVPSTSDMVTGMVDRFAWQVRRDLAPIQRHEDIRVLESRKDMDKPLRKPFKKALRLTKSNWEAACSEFERLNKAQPRHITLTFNTGLCREAVGDLDGAEELYDLTLELEAGKDYPTAGLSRIASRRRAAEQLAIHYGEPEAEHLADGDRDPGKPVRDSETAEGLSSASTS
ncbi:hypothetical protein K3152_01725 [Qipengyuania sp. 1NDH17]|uniref:Tetratricopeptide repeat protein n=1 Tax=Qipengyuania polymorpha TaxID=2867234 RepID=A0ABS7IYT8_9SPHN|nr:hypothetical protein [Qipengyuania polymorpha]MBX7456954.1 hypothetical protein [Qipengyuania polymorpha]